MFPYNIRSEIIKRLVEKEIIEIEDIYDVNNIIDELGKDKIFLVWTTNDVSSHADEIGVSLKEEQARNILHSLQSNHEASNGVNWDVIDSAILSFSG